MTTDSVKVVTEVVFRPFVVPNFAQLMMDPGQTGETEGPAIRVADLSREAIDALAAKWLDNLYATQTRPSPWSRLVSK